MTKESTDQEAGEWNTRPYTADELYADEADKKADEKPEKSEEVSDSEEEKDGAEADEKVAAKAEASEDEAGEEAEDEEKAAKKKDGHTVPYKRLSKEVAKRRAAEEEARKLREQITAAEKNKPKELTEQQSKVTVPEDGAKKPDPNDYDLMESDPKYHEDRDAWVLAEAERRTEAKLADQRKRDSEAQAAEAHAKLVQDFVDASHKYEDFDEAWENAELSRISPTLGQAFLEDPANGVEAAKYLADNDDALDALLEKSPTQQVAWFGKYTAQQKAAAPKESVKEKPAEKPKPSIGATKVPRNTSSGKKSERRPFGEMYSPEELYGE